MFSSKMLKVGSAPNIQKSFRLVQNLQRYSRCRLLARTTKKLGCTLHSQINTESLLISSSPSSFSRRSHIQLIPLSLLTLDAFRFNKNLALCTTAGPLGNSRTLHGFIHISNRKVHSVNHFFWCFFWTSTFECFLCDLQYTMVSYLLL